MTVKKMMLSILVFAYSAFAFIQTTFAWISVSEQNTIDGVDISASSDGGVELSLDGINFSYGLSYDDLVKEIGGTVGLRHITSLDGENFYRNFTNLSRAVGNREYITFDLWVRTALPTVKQLFLVENISNQVTYLEALSSSLDGTYVVSQGVEWESDATFDNGDNLVLTGDVNTYYAANAMRISIVERELEERFDLIESQSENLNSLIYDPSENEGRGYGVEIGAVSYYKAKLGETSIAVPTEKPNTVYKLTEFRNPYEAYDDSSLVATFVKGYDGYSYAKVTVNIWLEGWDADCMDSLFLDEVLVQLKFRGSSLIS